MTLLTPVAVNEALDEIRPYIEADGGYLEFVEIDYVSSGPGGKVRLHGACVGGPASGQTMTMGVERHVQNVFPEVVGVVQVL